MWSYIPGASSVSDLSLQLTDDIMKEIYQEIHDQEDKPFQEQNVPKDYVKMRFNFELETGSIELRTTKEESSRIASANFYGYHISLEKRLDSWSFCGNLMSMDVTDHYTKNTKFPQLISQSTIDDDDDPYFFTMMVDVNPLDSIADYRLLLSMKPLNIILSKTFLNRVIEFFNKPLNEIRRRKMEELNVKAYTRLREIRQQTEDQLIQAMADRKIFDVQVHLSAPNLMIPKNFEDENTSTLLLVLGTLSISSDLRGKRKRKKNVNNLTSVTNNNNDHSLISSSEPLLLSSHKDNNDFLLSSSPQDEQQTMEGFEELVFISNQSSKSKSKPDKDFSYLYDKFYLSLTSLEAGITTRSMAVDNLKATPDENLIEKFDVNLYLQICNIDSFDLPKVIVSGTLPSLKLHVSPEKTSTIMKILNKLNKSSTSDINMKRSKSSDRIELIDDPDQINNNSGSFKSEEESSNISSSVSTETSSSIKNEDDIPAIKKAEKQQILLKFSIPEASILFSEGKKEIALIWLHGISASYLKRTFDLQVTLKLHGLTIEDRYQEWGPDFRFLATSETLSLAQSVNTEVTDLIEITYNGINRDSPHFANVCHSVHFLFHKVHVTLNRETIIKLVGCMKNIQKSLKSESSSQPEQNKKEEEEEEQEQEKIEEEQEKQSLEQNKSQENDKDEQKSSANNNLILFSVTAKVNDITFTMNDTGVKIGIIQLRKSTFSFNVLEKTVKVEGKLGTMKIQDLDPGSKKYPQMFNTESNEDMITFTYETFKEDQPNFPGYGVLLCITINSIRYMWIERFQLRVRKYFSEIPEMQRLLSNTASSAAAVIKQKRLFRYKIKLNNPYIVVPQHVDTSRCLIIDLGEILIDKQFPLSADQSYQLTRIFVDVKAMNWKTGILGDNNIIDSKTTLAILDNTDLQLWWEKPSDENILNQHLCPNMNVWVYFPLLHLRLSEYQCWQICDTIVQNICAEPTEHELYVESLKDKYKLNQKDDENAFKNNEQEEQEKQEEKEEEEFRFQPDDEK